MQTPRHQSRCLYALAPLILLVSAGAGCAARPGWVDGVPSLQGADPAVVYGMGRVRRSANETADRWKAERTARDTLEANLAELLLEGLRLRLRAEVGGAPTRPSASFERLEVAAAQAAALASTAAAVTKAWDDEGWRYALAVLPLEGPTGARLTGELRRGLGRAYGDSVTPPAPAVELAEAVVEGIVGGRMASGGEFGR